MLTVYIDFKAPASYLALQPTLALAREQQLPLQWKPFRSAPRPRPTQVADEALAEAHRRARDAYYRRIHEHYAGLQGLVLRWSEEPRGADAALAALAGGEGDEEAFLWAAYQAYWVEQRDLNDPEVVRALAQRVGWALPGAWEPMFAQLEEAQSQALALGVVDAPCYELRGELFVGRQHLPWLREALAGPVLS